MAIRWVTRWTTKRRLSGRPRRGRSGRGRRFEKHPETYVKKRRTSSATRSPAVSTTVCPPAGPSRTRCSHRGVPRVPTSRKTLTRMRCSARLIPPSLASPASPRCYTRDGRPPRVRADPRRTASKRWTRSTRRWIRCCGPRGPYLRGASDGACASVGCVKPRRRTR